MFKRPMIQQVYGNNIAVIIPINNSYEKKHLENGKKEDKTNTKIL